MGYWNGNEESNAPEQLKGSLKQAIAGSLEAFAGRKRFSRAAQMSAESMVELLLTVRRRNLESEMQAMGISVTRSALSKRRRTLTPELMRDILLRFNAMCEDKRTYRGYRMIMAYRTEIRTARQGGYRLPVQTKYDVMNKVYLDAAVCGSAGTGGTEGVSPPVTLSGCSDNGEYRELWSAPWGIEAAAEEQRCGLRLANAHGRSDACLEQELWASMIFFNFCSRIAGSLVPPPERTAGGYRVNAAVTADLCRDFYRSPDGDGASLMRAIARYVEWIPAVPDAAEKDRNGFCFSIAT